MTRDLPEMHEASRRDLPGLRRATRADFRGFAVDVAPRLLGSVLRARVDGHIVSVRITEVEAYHGLGSGDRADPASHARMGRTARNATMWGDPGHLYVYLSHGIHSCVNVVCGPAGRGDGVLLRAAEVIEGGEVAMARSGRRGRDLARGPGRLGQIVGLRHAIHDGIDAVDGAREDGAASAADIAELWLAPPIATFATGPRVGVAGIAGTDAFPWRFWIPGDPTVSPFRWGRGATAARLSGPARPPLR